MISETSPTLIFEACYPEHTDLIRQVWAAAHAHGVKMTEQAHAWLDEPEFVLTELLKVPVENEPVKAVKLEYAHKMPLKPNVRARYNHLRTQLLKIYSDPYSFMPVPVDKRKSPVMRK